MRPFAPRTSRQTTILVREKHSYETKIFIIHIFLFFQIAVGIWVMGLLVALPQVLYFTTAVVDNSTYCVPVWPDADENGSSPLEHV